MSRSVFVAIAVGVVVAVMFRRILLRWILVASRVVVAAAIFVGRRLRRWRTAIRRALRWLRRRTGHVLAYIGSFWSKWAGWLWRHRSSRVRAVGRRVVAIPRTFSRPVRWAARAVFRNLFGIERLVSGHRAVTVALGPPTAGLEGPLLRSVYGERLDTLRVPFVIGDDREPVVDTGRRQIRRALDGSAEQIDGAVAAAQDLARALISSSEGRIDGIRGLVVPCAERAMARFLSVGDEHGPALFAAGQLLLHRVFLNPGSPVGLSDWYAERAASEALVGFRRLLDDGVRARLASGGDDEHAEATAIMLATALGPHVAWVTAHVLDELLRHPAHLGPVSAWGRDLPRATADGAPDTADERVRMILEAMRLHPVVPGLVRNCPHAADLQDGDNGRRRPLRAGVTFVYTRTAEFDPGVCGGRVFRFDPERFRPDGGGLTGPPTMSFSSGHHECLGRDVALRLMLAILDPLLAQEGVRRDPTKYGLLTTQLRKYSPLKASGSWPFPTNLYVVFEAGIRA